MSMRQDCKYFESRTYRNGETVRKCSLNLAPEAPWRCPAGCPSYEKRLADVAWSHGSLVTPPTPDIPDAEGIAEVLSEAQAVVNEAAPELVAELERQERRQRSLLGRLRRRLRGPRRDDPS